MTTYDQAKLVVESMRKKGSMAYMIAVGVEPDQNDSNNWIIRAYVRREVYDMMSDSERANYYEDDVQIIFEAISE